MPRFITKYTSATLDNAGNCCDNSIDRNSAIFFSKLATKLIDMTQAFQAEIDRIKATCNPTASKPKGILLAAVDTPVMTIGVKYEYIEYIKRYGPPPKGKFDETILQELRIELGIAETVTTI